MLPTSDKDVLSRAPMIDTEKCVENAGGNRYELVLIAAARVREIRAQQASSMKRQHVFPIISSLLDIQDGKVDRSYLNRVR